MAGAKSGRRTPRRAAGGGRPRPAAAGKPARSALGNDPFARGAAQRPAAAGSRGITPAPTRAPTPTATRITPAIGATLREQPPRPQPVAEGGAVAAKTRDAAQKLGALERRVEATLAGLEARLAGVTSLTGLASARGEIKDAAARLVPRAREILAAMVDLVRFVEPAERLDPWGRDARFGERAEPLLELLYAGWWRADARGLEHVPARGPLVVVANHGGLVPWDALVLLHALRRDHPGRRDLRPLLDDRECALPIFGPAAVRLGAVRASPDAAEAILRGGGAIGVFPEGSAGAKKPWRERYRLQRFGRGGFVKIALRTGAAIVPCAIVGSEEATLALAQTGWLADRLGVPALSSSLPRVGAAAALPLPSRWSLRFGAPVALEGLGPDAALDAAVVNALTERVRATLQAMLDESVAARGSVFL